MEQPGQQKFQEAKIVVLDPTVVAISNMNSTIFNKDNKIKYYIINKTCSTKYRRERMQ